MNYYAKQQKKKQQRNLAARPQSQVSTPYDVGNCWCFGALDTLFFKESRPMESIGGAQLQSVFPPPARTLIGAVRTAIGSAHDVDWGEFHKNADHPLRTVMGHTNDLGQLSFKGPFLVQDGKRLFAAPLVVLKGVGKDAQPVFTRLAPSTTPTVCDLGNVRLPQKQDSTILGAKPLEHTWLTGAGLQAVLDGKTPSASDLVQAQALFDTEERLGIGRAHATRTTGDGLLYQTQHVRPKHNVEVGMHVHGLEQCPAVPAEGLMRLGAEGRIAHWRRNSGHTLPACPVQDKSKSNRIMLVLMTHAHFANGWLPDGLTEVTLANGQTAWEGDINGVSLRLVCAVVGKSVREGGWDLANQKPRPIQNLVPAGSCYFFEVLCADPNGEALRKLHGSHTGQDTAYGRGEIAVGLWK